MFATNTTHGILFIDYGKFFNSIGMDVITIVQDHA